MDGILALDSSTQESDEVKAQLRDSLQNYYGVNLHNSNNRAITEAWDKAQEKMSCCAVEDQSWLIYRGSEWYKEQPGVEGYNKPMVPPSCCIKDKYDRFINREKCQTFKTGPPSRKSGEANEALHYRGCFFAGEDFPEEYDELLVAIGIRTNEISTPDSSTPSPQESDKVRAQMFESLQNYYGINLDDSSNRAITEAWDKAQENMNCCAVEDQSWGIYRGSEWYKQQPGVEGYNKPMVPSSCCIKNQYNEYVDLEKCQTFKTGPPSHNSGEANEALHYKGCFHAGQDFPEEYDELLVAIGIRTGTSSRLQCKIMTILWCLYVALLGTSAMK